MSNGTNFTNYGWAVCFWVLIIAFQYGYHISVLNQIQAVLTCKGSAPPTSSTVLPTCFPISDFTFSLVTSIFTVGGLAGSLVADRIMDKWGRRGSQNICAVFIALGNLSMGYAPSVPFLCFGRFLIGIGSGVGLCVGPIFLAEIAPTKISGNVGVLTQLSIVLGIMFTQIAGINLATPTSWRFVFFISFVLSAVQLLFSSFIVESPTWLLGNNRPEDYERSRRRLWGTSIPVEPSEETLLNPSEEIRSVGYASDNISALQSFSLPALRRPLLIVCFAMLSQQVSGINAVLYYSNDILAKSLPDFGPYISIGITVINVIMTFPPIILIERIGRKRLLLTSIYGALLSLVVVGISLNGGMSTLASLAIIAFVMSFAIGLGPLPFVMIPEVSPAYAVSALSSVALSLNWIVNFVVGLAFLPIRNFLSNGDRYKEGRVFYLFCGLLFLAMLPVLRYYK